MNNYKVDIQDFQGPLDLLLSLIEQEEMEITKVSLANVADQYMYYIHSHPEIPPEEIADFLVIASKLLLIKSKALLPTLDLEDEDAIDLEKQLKMYKQYLDASKKINKILLEEQFSYAKEKYPPNMVEGFQPPKKISIDKMRDVYELMLKRLEPVVVLPKKAIEKVMSIKEKIKDIRDKIFQHACVSFQTMVCDTGSRGDTIVSFLAMLELIKQKVVHVEQEDYLGDIAIKKREGAEEREISTETEFL